MALQFGPFEFDPESHELRKHGLRIRIPEQSLLILSALLEKPGELVTRDRIRELLWPDGTCVEFEGSINAAVKALRNALSDPATTARFVERVPRQGYRFTAPVRVTGQPEPERNEAQEPPVPPRNRGTWAIGGAALMATLVGSAFWLRSAGPARGLAERDMIVIADFGNQTQDAVLGGALGQALAAQISQSPYLRIASSERVSHTLSLMGQTGGAQLAPQAAREVCRRIGGSAVLAGTVGTVGDRYYIALQVSGCSDGSTIDSEYVEADSKNTLLASLRRAVTGLRERLGESLASIGKLDAPPEASTSSLEALNSYGIALARKAVGDDPIPFLARAVELDPNFPMAHLALALVYLNRGLWAEAEAAISKAYALRGKVSERERLAIEDYFHVLASGDLPQAVAAGTLLGELYPHDVDARRSAFLPCALAGDFQTAAGLARAGLDLAPDSGVSYFNAAVLLLNDSNPSEAKAVLRRAEARGIGYDLFPFARYIAAALEGDAGAMDREAKLSRGQPFEYLLEALQAQQAAYSGQFAMARAIAKSASSGGSASAASLASSVALAEAVVGLESVARERALSAVRLDSGRRAVAPSALALALSGSTGDAETLAAGLHRRYPNDTLLHTVWLPAVRGAAALRRGDPDAALEATEVPEQAARYAWPAYIRGLAYLKLRRGENAASQFRAIVGRKGHLFTGTFVYGAAFAYAPAQLGLARALAMEDRLDESRQAYREALAVWRQADPDLPLLAQAKRELAALRGGAGH